MVTNSSLQIADFILSRFIAECGLSGSNRQAHKLKIGTVASDLSWIPSRVCLPVEPTLFAFSKMVYGKELRESSLK